MKTPSRGKLYAQLFLTMLKIGAITFGGGYAMIALLENEFVQQKKWLEKDEFLNMAAISESTPGPIAINSATYIGYKAAGMMGAVVATLGMVIPSFAIIYLISLFFDQFLALTWVGYAFRGIQVCVIYLILTAGLKLLKELERNALNGCILTGVMAAMLLCSLFAVKFSSVFCIFISGVIGVMIFLVGEMRRKGGAK